MYRDPARLRELADSYLEHMLIILRVNDRGANLRNFLDPWWSFTRGGPFVTGHTHYSQQSMNNPCACMKCAHRDRLFSLDWISDGAREARARGACKNKQKEGKTDLRDRRDQLIVEHSVPLARIVNDLFEKRAEWTMDSLRDYLSANYKRALLTREEDDKLNIAVDGLKLAADMPLGWQSGDDPYSRYHARTIIGASPVHNPV